MKKVLFLTALVLCVSATKGFANDLIVRYHQDPTVAPTLMLGDTEVLVDSLKVYKLEPLAPLALSSVIETLKSDPNVRWVQEDHPVTMRATPNDPNFDQQWGLHNDNDSDINAPEAWEYSKGGKDANGHDVVVAIVDGGVDTSHSNLEPNMWMNAGEVAGNGVDDDGNGYVDDIYGWNAYNSSGNIPSSRHGTHVAGIAGARGDDSSLVTGVNWDVKLMAVAGSSGTTSTILKAYGYVLKQKQMWLESGGEQGANVVSTNSSFGVDYAKCDSGSYPAWNDIYNEMGEHGILSAAATINNNVNVDRDGDVPTGCSSPYIVAVTNTQVNGTKYGRAGYGETHIDLGAPGTSVLSTLPGERTGNLTGTSMATPHVAGAIAFLHSVASKEFSDSYLRSPGEAALALKQILLETVTPQGDLEGKTVSGGRLNLNSAAQRTLSYKGAL